MFIIELIVLFLIFSVSITQLILDHVWSDKRTLRNKRIRNLLFIFIVALLICSVVLSVIKDHKTTILQQKNDSLLVLIQKSNELVHNDIKLLQENIYNLDKQLNPFIKLALQKYPNNDTNSALSKLENELNEIKKSISEVNSFTINVRLSFPTILENKDLDIYRIALGKIFIAGVKFTDKTFFYLNSDEMQSTIQYKKDSIIYFFVYHPANNTNILGSQIERLKNIQFFISNYSDPLNTHIDSVKNTSIVTMCLSAEVNNIKIGEKYSTTAFELFKSGNMVLDISSIFKNIELKFSENFK